RCLQFDSCLGKRKILPEQNLIGPLYILSALGSEAVSLQANLVYPHYMGLTLTTYHGIRNHIHKRAGDSTDKSVITDTGELVNRDYAPDCDMIANLYMPGHSQTI